MSDSQLLHLASHWSFSPPPLKLLCKEVYFYSYIHFNIILITRGSSSELADCNNFGNKFYYQKLNKNNMVVLTITILKCFQDKYCRAEKEVSKNEESFNETDFCVSKLIIS
jgi:hypothetical protein